MRVAAFILLGIAGLLLAYVGHSNWKVHLLMEEGLRHDGRIFAESFVQLSIAMISGIIGVCLYKE